MSGADFLTLPMERRHCSRVSTDLEAQRRASSRVVHERICNLSTGGLLLRGRERLPLGSRAELSMKAPSGNLELTVRGEIVRVWCGQEHDELLTGVRFVDLAPRTIARLEVLLVEAISVADARRASRRFDVQVPALWSSGLPAGAPGDGRDRFAGCSLGETLHQGGRSTVYAGVPATPRSGPKIAIKHFTGAPAEVEARAYRFCRAVSVSRAVKAGVVACTGSQSEGNECWLAMERVEGRTLAELLGALAAGHHAPPVRSVVSVVGEAIAVLIRCQQQLGTAFAHGALDASCIYVCPDGSVKLGGFDGDLDRRARTGLLAPELVLSLALPTPQSDVFALGALLYEALTGIAALNVPPHVLARSAQRGPMAPSRRNGAVTAALDRAVLAALKLEPSERPQGPIGLLQALNACAALAPAASARQDRLALLKAASVAESLRRETLPRVRLPHEPAPAPVFAPRPSITGSGAGAEVGPGSVVGRYTLLDLLGRGETHCVWLARAQLPEGGWRSAAVKTLREDRRATSELAAAVLEEGRLATLLTHPNLVQVLDVGLHAGRPYLATEYVGGRPLSQLRAAATQRGVEVPEELAARIAAQCCSGLHAVHALTDGAGHPMNVVHGALSARHVLVAWGGEAKLIDLGRGPARIESVRTEPGALRGTLGFLAPEQLKGAPASPSFDVWALGVNLYLLVTGRMPFEAAGNLQTASAILRAAPMRPRELRPGLSEELERIILRALEKRAVDRYASAEELRADLDRFLRGKDASVRAVGRLMDALFPPIEADRRRLSELEGRAAPRALA